ncbi:MAG: hypothetical protein GY892_07600 [Shimia sp.]|nr:hypothetical protein [Shimia sp.]
MSDSANAARSNSFNNSMNMGSSFGVNSGSMSSFVDQSQQPYLDAVRGMGLGMIGQGSENVAQGQGQNQAMLNQALIQNQALMDPNAQIAAQTSSLQSGLGDLFRNEINPAIQSNAMMAGGLGGGRQGVAQGVAAGELSDTYASAVGDIVARANAQAQGAVNSAPGLGQANLANRGAAAGYNMNQLGQFSSILGGPTVLQQSQQMGRQGSSSFGTSRAGSQSIAEGYTKSRAQSKSKESSFNFSWM